MAEDLAASDIGRRLRQIRHAKRKSLKAVAGLAGISESYLSRLESGERALDRRSLIAALAKALDVAPTEITGVSAVLTTPGELAEDQWLGGVRLALLAISMDEPDGQVLPVHVLTRRASEVLAAQRDCRYSEVGQRLPGLIRDLHSTAKAGADVLKLLALTHVQGTQAWLMDVGASLDLAWQAAALARNAAETLGDDEIAQAVSVFGTSFGLMGAGAFDLAERVLSATDVGTDTSEAMQVSGMLALTSSLLAAARGDQAQRVAAIEHASDLARHTGEGNALWFGFGPSNVGVWRMSVALEMGEHAEAARIGGTINPAALPSPTRRSAYWREYGRALARLPRRQDEAVLMLRRAEEISPARIHRHPFMRSVLAELLVKAKRDAVGRELRGMAYRAGLPV